jgi:hypothetical protein
LRTERAEAMDGVLDVFFHHPGRQSLKQGKGRAKNLFKNRLDEFLVE